jgi:ribosome maturation factor RimP
MSGLTAHFLFAENFRVFRAGFKGNFRPLAGKSMGARRSGLAAGVLGTMAVKLEAIRSAAARVAASHGLDLVDIEWLARRRSAFFAYFSRKTPRAGRAEGGDCGRGRRREPARAAGRGDSGRHAQLERLEQLSGITHEDCAAFSRDFGVLLDVEDLVPGAEYTLEASSPGLDRKLTRPEDFQRFAGNLVKVQTFEPIRNNRHWQGRLTARSTGARAITLDLNAVKQNSKSRKAGVSTVEIALETSRKAQLVPEI